MSETCCDCERDFLEQFPDWDDESEMWVCSTCVCVREQSEKINVLQAKISRLERSIEQNQMHEMEMREIDAMDRGCD